VTEKVKDWDTVPLTLHVRDMEISSVSDRVKDPAPSLVDTEALMVNVVVLLGKPFRPFLAFLANAKIIKLLPLSGFGGGGAVGDSQIRRSSSHVCVCIAPFS
jgi:hypothetical protein